MGYIAEKALWRSGIRGGIHEGVVAQWCHPLTMQTEQSGGEGSRTGRAQSLECMTWGSWTRFSP